MGSQFWDAIFFAVAVFVAGLLFIDLVPLQETMVCKDYANTTTCPEGYFSTSYQDAREKFLAAALAAQGRVEQHFVVRQGSEEYFIDSAYFPGKLPGKLLVHASGTHGVEGYTGSAIQTKLLREWNESAVAGPSVLFLHAINPYGMAHYRRFNERNVDLNRNYLSAEEWAAVRSRDPNAGGYDTVRHLLNPKKAPRLLDRYVFFYDAAKGLFKYGFTTLKRALVTGQYHDPQGLYFGGDGEQTSLTLLRRILTFFGQNVEEAIFLDVHTGLGPYGVDTMMVSNEVDEARAKRTFPGARVQNDKTAKSGPSGGYDLAMGIIRPSAELGPNTLSLTEEFGTVNPIFVARALVLENAARNTCPGSYVHQVMQSWVRDAFYPQEMSYKQSTLRRGTAAFWQAIHALSQ